MASERRARARRRWRRRRPHESTASTPAGSQRENGRGASTEATRPSIAQPYAGAGRRGGGPGRIDSVRTPVPLLGCAAVTLSVQLGLLLAFVTALMSVLGFLLKHRGAVAAPAVEWRARCGSTIALFRSPVYALGCVVATTSWGFHVGALALAPISLVQSVIAGGLVLVTVSRTAPRPRRHAARVDRRGAHRRRPRLPRGHAGGQRPRRARRPRRAARSALYVGLATAPGLALAALRAARAACCWRSRPACCGPARTWRSRR